MRLSTLLLLLLPLAGCSYSMYLTDADEHGGRINMVTGLNHGSAIDKANDHCQDYHLVARIVSDDPASNSMTFVCQPPP
jgi:hypothetical protein